MSCSETCLAQSGTSQRFLWVRSFLLERLGSQRVWVEVPLLLASPGAQKEHLLVARALPLMVTVGASYFQHPVKLGYPGAEDVEWERQVWAKPCSF